MTLMQMKMFIKIAERGSFTLAANDLYISQPGLTRQINSLEKELGFSLLVRTTRKVELTNEGRIMLKYFTEACSQVEKGIKECSGEEARSLRVYMPSLFHNRTVITLLEDFKKAEPEIALYTMFYPNLEEIDDEQINDIDIIIGFGDLLQKNSNLELFELCSLEYQLIFSSEISTGDTASVFDRLSKMPLLIFQSSNAAFRGDIPDYKGKANLHGTHIIEMPNSESLFLNVRDNRGFAIVDEAASIPAQYSIERVGLGVSHSLCAGWAKKNTKSNVNIFIRFLQSYELLSTIPPFID